MTDPPPRIERHEATDRFGKAALRTAHDLGKALADDDPVVVRTDGPHRTLDGLAALIDAALAGDAPAGDGDGDHGDGDPGDGDGDDARRRRY
jgi:hypothetical protein